MLYYITVSKYAYMTLKSARENFINPYNSYFFHLKLLIVFPSFCIS